MAYNGLTNYETWATTLWLDNDQCTYHHMAELAEEQARKEAAGESTSEYWTPQESSKFNLADQIKDFVEEELLPDLEASLASDLLSSAVQEINWNEIAESYLEEARDTIKEEQS